MDIQKERYRRIRGAILKLLAHQHPGPVDFKVLQYLLDDLRYTVSEDELKSHIHYLADKKFLKQESRKTSSVCIDIVSITAEGLDVLDGFHPDVGVDVRF